MVVVVIVPVRVIMSSGVACVDMVTWLMEDYGFERYDAVELLGQAAHLYIANVVDPQFSVACALNKKYLPR